MIERGRISNIQAAMLGITSLTIIGHLIILTLIFDQSHQDSWIAVIVGTVFGLVGVLSLSKLCKSFPEETLIQILMNHFSWPGKVIGFLYLLYFFVMVVLGVRLFAEAYRTIFTETPRVVFIIVIILLTAYIVYLGLETLGRVNQIMLAVLVLFAISVVFLTMNQGKDYSNLLPIMGQGLMPVAKGAITVVGWFGEFVVMGMIFPYTKMPKKLIKTGFFVSLVTLIFFLGPITGPIALFGPNLAANMTFPTFSEVRYIAAGEVINRFDAIAILFWTVGLMIRISIFYYGLILGTAQFFKLDSYRPLVIPFAWFIGVCALIFTKNFSELTEFLYQSYVPLNLLMGILLPLIFILVLPLIKKNQNAKSESP
jgi:spore germination protein KB